jgi:hypothetical protein
MIAIDWGEGGVYLHGGDFPNWNLFQALLLRARLTFFPDDMHTLIFDRRS